MDSLFTKPEIPNPVGTVDPGMLLSNVVNAALLFAGAVTVLFLIVGGFRYIVSMGNAEGVEKARQTVVYAILGMLIIFLAYAAVAYLLGGLNVSPAYQLG